MAESTSVRPGVLSLAIKDKNALYAAYMPFVNNGGLFIPTNREYKMGQEIFMLLTLMDNPEKLPIAGKVIWKTPVGSVVYRVAGIGLQLSDKDGGSAKARIEAYLSGVLNSERPTHTM
ncbi:MAG: PilZ domain-containing protein [Methylococcaceae bacterium]